MGLFPRPGKTGTGSVTAATPPLTPQQQQQRQRELASETARKIDAIEAAMAADMLLPPAASAASATTAVTAAAAAVAGEELPAAAVAPESAAVIDEVAILYAQGQLALAIELLTSNLSDASERSLWWLLFDLYQLSEQRDAFDALSLAYARCFESSPPGWRAPTAERSVRAQLVLELAQLATPESQAQLLATLQSSPATLRLTGADALLAALRDNLISGQRERSQTPWLLALELLQRLQREAEFDQIALDYCATYEISPPAFRPVSPLNPTSATSTSSAGANDSLVLPAALHAPLGGLQSRIIAYAAQHPRLIFDASQVRQLDYLCAQQLLTCLGNLDVLSIEFRHVSHPLAALLRLLGFATLARIVPHAY